MGKEPKKHVDRVSDEVITQVVEELAELDCESSFDLFCARGQLVVGRFYGGSIDRYRSRNPNKSDSLRRLVAHPHFKGTKTVIVDSINVYDACRRLPQIRNVPRILPSHVVAALRLPDSKVVEWLQKASGGRWTVDELNERISEYRRECGETRGAPYRTEAELAVTAAGRFNRSVDELATAVTSIATFDADSLTSLEDSLATTRDKIEALYSKVIAARRSKEATAAE